MSTNYRLRNRLEHEGRLQAFKEFRESIRGVLVANGIPENSVWRVAALLFPPLDGSPHEVDCPDHYVQIADALGLFGTSQKPAGPSKIPEQNLNLLDTDTAEPREEDFAISGESWSESPAAPLPPQPSLPPAPPLIIARPAVAHGVQTAAMTAKSQRDAAFSDLFERVDRKKRCKPYDMVQWVFEHAGINPGSLDPGEVPSAGALRYLQLVQESNVAYAEFMKTLYSKTIPDKRQLDYEAKQREDGTAQLKLLDQFDAEFAALRQQRVAGVA